MVNEDDAGAPHRSYFKRGSRLPPPGAATRRSSSSRWTRRASATDDTHGTRADTQAARRRKLLPNWRRGKARQAEKQETSATARAKRTGLTQEERIRALMEREVRLGSKRGRNVKLAVILLISAVLVVVVVLGSPLYNFATTYYQSQQAHSQLAQAQAENERLKAQIKRWKNPDYISAQARERLGYLRPGETRYQVLDPGPPYDRQHTGENMATPRRPWFMQIVDSQAQAAKSQAQDAKRSLRPGMPQKGATQAPAGPDKKKQK